MNDSVRSFADFLAARQVYAGGLHLWKREWMSTTDPDIERRNVNTEQQIEEIVRSTEARKLEVLTALRATSAQRRIAERVVAKVGRRRIWTLLYMHSDMQRRFLSLMVPLGIAAHPNWKELATEIGRYYSNNYAYEWCRNYFSRPLRMVARDMILRGADSTFGDTPQAGHLGYVLTHHEELGIENVSRYSELFTRNLALERENFFRDEFVDQREALELDRYMARALQKIEDNIGS